MKKSVFYNFGLLGINLDSICFVKVLDFVEVNIKRQLLIANQESNKYVKFFAQAFTPPCYIGLYTQAYIGKNVRRECPGINSRIPSNLDTFNINCRDYPRMYNDYVCNTCIIRRPCELRTSLPYGRCWRRSRFSSTTRQTLSTTLQWRRRSQLGRKKTILAHVMFTSEAYSVCEELIWVLFVPGRFVPDHSSLCRKNNVYKKQPQII